jgi:hypothetical protein
MSKDCTRSAAASGKTRRTGKTWEENMGKHGKTWENMKLSQVKMTQLSKILLEDMLIARAVQLVKF